ncbi:MAG: hypothetical protein VKO39_10030 [Cyanobacteriota bacterium]|nr:hypothetical protein [Cyanobacteriota bacterium]
MAAPAPPHPWERGQGHPGPPERHAAYARFRAWLDLGPARSLATYAAVLGVSKQSLSETAARYRWRERAAAWDAAEAAAGRCLPPSPPRPRAARSPVAGSEAVPAPTPAAWPTGEAAALAEDHLRHLQAYHALYLELGQAMAGEAKAALEVVAGLRESVVFSIERRRSLVEQGDHRGAAEATSNAATIASMLSRMAAAAATHATGGRQHWGDAIGMGKVVEEALKLREKAR